MTWLVTFWACTVFHAHIAQLGHAIEVIHDFVCVCVCVKHGSANGKNLWWMIVVQKWATVKIWKRLLN